MPRSGKHKMMLARAQSAGDRYDREDGDRDREDGHRSNRRSLSQQDRVEHDSDSDSGSEFWDTQQQMRQMSQMFRDPFGDMLALPGARQPRDSRRQQQQAQNMAVATRDGFMNPFAHFDSMFSNMRSMMTDMHRAFEHQQSDPNSQVYQQSSFVQYSNTGNGAPKYYQASSSTRQGPGGVRETRKAVRDSEKGVEQVAVGHHIHDRGHVIERKRSTRSGEQEENQEYINLDEEEASRFDHEYQDKWRSAMRGVDHRNPPHAPIGDGHGRRRQRALPSTSRKPSNRD